MYKQEDFSPADHSRDWEAVFRDFHKNPELSFAEYRTTEKIRSVLAQEHIEIIETDMPTGIIARVRGTKRNDGAFVPNRKIALRADIDALPVTEESGLSYSSCNPGVMHACGHDFHTTVGLMCACSIQRIRDRFSGEIWFLFQPGEEAFYGAERLYTTGVIPDMDAYFGFHAQPDLAVGQVGIVPGPLMASVDGFHIAVTGVGTHAATPEKGNNPIPALMNLIAEITDFDTQQIPKDMPHVISFTHLQAGNTWNVIPKEAICEGTVRTFDEVLRHQIETAFRDAVSRQISASKVAIDLTWTRGSAPVINDASLCAFTEKVAQEQHLTNVVSPPSMLGEDFGYYLQKDRHAKGIYMRIGTGKSNPLHHPGFQISPSALPVTSSFLCDLLTNAMKTDMF